MPEQPFEPPYRPFLYIPRTADDIGEVRPQLAPGQSPRDHGLVWLRGGIPWPMDTVFPDQHVSPRVLVRNGSIAPSSACIVQIRLYRKEEAGLIMKANFRDVAMEVGPGAEGQVVGPDWHYSGRAGLHVDSWVLVATAFDPFADPIGEDQMDWRMDRHIGARAFSTWTHSVVSVPLTEEGRTRTESVELRRLRVPRTFGAGRARTTHARVAVGPLDNSASCVVPHRQFSAPILYGLVSGRLAKAPRLREIRAKLANEVGVGTRRSDSEEWLLVVVERRAGPVPIKLTLWSEKPQDRSDVLLAI